MQKIDDGQSGLEAQKHPIFTSVYNGVDHRQRNGMEWNGTKRK